MSLRVKYDGEVPSYGWMATLDIDPEIDEPGYMELSAESYGASEAEARANLLASLRMAQQEIRDAIAELERGC